MKTKIASSVVGLSYELSIDVSSSMSRAQRRSLLTGIDPLTLSGLMNDLYGRDKFEALCFVAWLSLVSPLAQRPGAGLTEMWGYSARDILNAVMTLRGRKFDLGYAYIRKLTAVTPPQGGGS